MKFKTKKEAFFGSSMVNSDLVEFNFEESATAAEESSWSKDRIESATLNCHQISLDENLFKLAQQQNKKGQLELGIEDFLDGDIVSYLFNENRNLMEFNPEQGFIINNSLLLLLLFKFVLFVSLFRYE